MKKILWFAALLALCLMASGCQSRTSPGDALKNSLKNGDPEQAKAYEEAFSKIDFSNNKEKAAENGDSYCASCKKFIEGKVRICPYCGQYIK